MLKPQQTQRIYAMGARLGLVESGNKNDLLHELVFSISQKNSVRELDEKEYKKVVSELALQLKAANLTEPKTVHPFKAQKREKKGIGKMSDGQIRKVWQLMYSLEKLDIKPSSARLGDRLCGIIKKELHIDAIPKDPFSWLTYQQGVKLIEILKNTLQMLKGGRTVEIHLDDLIGTQRDIAEVIGIENYIKLCKAFGGDTVYIQNIQNCKKLNAMLKSKQSTTDTTAVSLQKNMISPNDMSG